MYCTHYKDDFDYLPEISVMSDCLTHYFSFLSPEKDDNLEFILIQLLKTCLLLTYSDEAGRNNILQELKICLNSCYLTDHLIESIVHLYRAIFPADFEFMRFVFI
jgi:hypothetical protein